MRDRMRAGPPVLLRMVVFGVFFFPSTMVVEPLGAAGTVPIILSLVLLLLWCASAVFGLHDPLSVRHPGRLAIGSLLFVTLLSYAAFSAGLTGGSYGTARAAADRWLLVLLASFAVIVVAGETIRTMDDALRYVRALLNGALFCSLVAVVQFTVQANPMEWVGLAMPGFVDNGGATVYQVRGAMVRVAGSTFTPIELGVVCAMVLPLSIWRLIYDPRGRRWVHALGTALLVFSIAATISRSGVLGVVVALATLFPFLPRPTRVWTTLVAPAALVALFMTVPGLMSTLGNALNPPADDPSLTTRLNNYPRVVAMIEERPWLGLGPGTYLHENALQILDNQYLYSAVTIGLVGLAGTVVYLTLPALTTLHAARTARTPVLRALAGAVTAGCAVAAVGSATFDSLSFPVFTLTYPALVGLGGAVWIMVRRQTRLPRPNAPTWAQPVTGGP
jgi:O-antigen ligase